MKKIFCITCHQLTSPLTLTVKYLSSFDSNQILIHVDKKSDINDFLFLESSNVVVLNDRVNVSWGAVSQIKATLLLLSKASQIDFDYLFFLSGDDLPCMRNEDIDAFIERINYKNMIHYQDSRNNHVDPIGRVKYNYPAFFFSKENNLNIKVKRKAFSVFKFLFKSSHYKYAKEKGVVFYKGTNWFSFNRKTVGDVLEFVTNNNWYLNVFEQSLCGDEVFFHTLLKFIGVDDIFHDPEKVNDVLRYIDWSTGPDYPRILYGTDLYRIKKSGCIFARKFPQHVGEGIFVELLKKQ